MSEKELKIDLNSELENLKKDIDRKDGLDSIKREIKQLTKTINEHNNVLEKLSKYIEESNTGTLPGMVMSEENVEIIKALVAANGEIESIEKNSKNPFFKSDYANLDDIRTALRPILHKHNLTVTQSIPDAGNGKYM